MKPVYKCEYCSFIGPEEEVRKHEQECYCNNNSVEKKYFFKIKKTKKFSKT